MNRLIHSDMQGVSAMELLAPAGNLEKLKWAITYGADAVYFGTKFGSLRSFAGNFSLDEAAEGLDYLHRRGKKGYVTFNIYPFSHEYDRIVQSVRTLDEMGADAFIVADLGVLTTLKRMDLKADLFVSTQANTTSYQTALALKDLGAKRVNLARELSFEQILAIQKETRGEIDAEVFIHGALCFSYSGRCAISDHLTGYSANRGQCKQPCRWKYSLVEETRPGQYMPVYEDDRGLYLFSSKDLALFEFVPALRDAGVHSMKIEGRMKSIHYVASVVALYRQVIDGKTFSRQEGMDLLHRVSNRGYTIGFMKGKTDLNDYAGGPDESGASSIFVGNVRETADAGRCVMEVRNKVFQGEQLEILSPGGLVSQIRLPEPLTTTDGRYVTTASNPQSIFLDQELVPYTVLRRITER